MYRRRGFAGQLLVDDRAAHRIEVAALDARRESERPHSPNDFTNLRIGFDESVDGAACAAG
jgi:hypothetical protein